MSNMEIPILDQINNKIQQIIKQQRAVRHAKAVSEDLEARAARQRKVWTDVEEKKSELIREFWGLVEKAANRNVDDNSGN